jgi:di/tricarboxylate transporter
VVCFVSGLLNNTPVVVIFIPIIAALAREVDISVSKVMMPLSYVAIAGGMTTLIGSSTNLLVSGSLINMDLPALEFFEFTHIGLVLAGVSFIYIFFIVPRLLPDRASMARSLVTENGREFVAQIELEPNSEYVGRSLTGGTFPEFSDIVIKMIQRGEHAFLPPFEDQMTLRSGDVVIVAATRKELGQLLAKAPSTLLQNLPGAEKIKDTDDDVEMHQDINLAEVIITPASRMIGRTLEQVAFHHNHHCVVLGIQRHSRVIRSRVSEIRLAAGDVLLVVGKRQDVMQLQESKDMLLLEWLTEEIHSGSKGVIAGTIFAFVVGVAALNLLPIVIASFVGAGLTILTGCLNVRQARRSIDSQVVFIVAASLAMGVALQATGGATYIAHQLINIMDGASPYVVLSALFALMVVITNVLSNNATAVLFTPIAVGTAQELGVDYLPFVYAVIFASNCSFVTPIGYQTNLLVMGPGHYKFSDFFRAGAPLAFIIWITYSLFAPWYFG